MAKILFGPFGDYTSLNSGQYGGLGRGYSNSNPTNGGFRCTHHPLPTCPTGYVEIAPMSPYTTSRFCVAQYEAKQSGSKGVSLTAVTPWVYITRDSAQTACAANEAGYCLITNAEWQTVARTIEAIPSNWSGSSVGSGAINRGNSNSDQACAVTGSNDYGINGPGGCTSTLDFTRKLTRTLPNGTIYDLAGNITEWVNDDNTTDFGIGNILREVKKEVHFISA